MRVNSCRPALTLAASLAVLVSIDADAQASFSTQDAKRGPARLLVVAKEFSYSLSRPRVRAGRVIVQLANAGEDVHNLRIRRLAAKRHHSISRIDPGGRAQLNRKLKPSRYYLWCSVADHEQRGMRARLIARRR